MKISTITILIFLLSGCTSSDDQSTTVLPPTVENAFYRGMDLSFTAENAVNNVSFIDQDGSAITDFYTYVAGQGVNIVRLRLWMDDDTHPYGLENLKREALKVRDAGMDFLLDFHYSTTWADPGRQNTPATWQSMTINELSVAVADYTTDVLEELAGQNTVPAVVQIGNETNNGMLWPSGIIYSNGTENWNNYVRLTNSAIGAVRSVAPESKVMVHHAGLGTAAYYFGQLTDRDVDFDLIGLSYYPWWHDTTPDDLQAELLSLSNAFSDKRIMIVETGYPHTLQWNDNLNNLVGLSNQVSTGYPASNNGQKDFLQQVRQSLESLPDSRGAGFCYWAPDWISYSSSATSFMGGSAWENVALFDFNGTVLPAMQVFRE